MNGYRVTESPAADVQSFLQTELSLGKLQELMPYLWLAGSERPVSPLLSQIVIGRDIVPCERMDLHLVWHNRGTIYIKPLPRFLLDRGFWAEYLVCKAGCRHNSSQQKCRKELWQISLGFLYSYVCLLSYESDFRTANEKGLLPRLKDDSPIQFTIWKQLADEILTHQPDEFHPRFRLGELRLSRLNFLCRCVMFRPMTPYFSTLNNYEGLFRNNITWLVATTVFIALALTAMQVGLATEHLQGNETFVKASYGFAVFAILWPICVFGLAVLFAMVYLILDSCWLRRSRRRWHDQLRQGGYLEQREGI